MTRGSLPPPIARYLRRAVPDPPAEPRGTALEQRGEMRLGPDRPWMPFTATQTIAADRTAFVWRARAKMAPLATATVEDAYEEGRGRLDARLWGLIRVAHARGPAVDRGEAQRYLAELAWCPLALAHNPQLRFEALSHDVVRVRLRDDEETYVDLRFDAEGDLVATKTLTRQRGDAREPWEGRFSEVRDFGGIRAPAKGEVRWETPDGPFVYWRGEVTSLRWGA